MEESLREERLKKLDEIKSEGIDPYPAKAERDFSLAEAREKFEDGKEASIAGRVMSVRDQGNIIFIDIKDESDSFQLVLKKELTDKIDFWRKVLDRGDFVSAKGKLFTTQKGEKSLETKELKILTKALLPIPSEWYGVEDVETRLRKRYLDLLSNPETKQLFIKKTLFWDTTRNFLKKAGFMEVETSVMEEVPGGADAEPFLTHHNALNQDFYLRISLELPLKRLIVGGFDRVFEIGKVFRNEGVDREHLQEYTSLEFYWAYADYKDLMRFTEKMYKKIIEKVLGGLKSNWQGVEIDWGGKWQRIDYVKIFRTENNGLNPSRASEEKLVKRAEELGISLAPGLGKGKLIDLIYKKTVRPKLIQPAFLINHPVEISPLSKKSERDPGLVERIQVVACGTELGNGWSEINDPLDQLARFEEQEKARAKGDKEAQRLDEDYVEALEYGMPPTAGFGLSERLFAVLMDKPVRETVLFPLMRPKR